MDKLWFSQPLRVWTKPGRAKIVRNVEQAAESLLYDWPEEWKTAAKNREARKSCMVAVEGEIGPDDVRKKEANVLDYKHRG